MNAKENIAKIKSNVLNSEVAVKIIKNSSWMIGDKVFTMIIGVFVTAIVARYFGPESYGQFNYALSFVTLFTALSTLGLETLTVKAIVDKDQDEGTILCTSLVLRVIGGILLTFIAVILIRLIEPNDSNTHILVFILSLTMVFNALEVIEYWIQAHQRAKISSVVRMTAYVIIAAFKIGMVLLGGNLIHFALIHMLNVIIIGIGLIIAYFRNREEKFKWKVDISYAKSILSQSWYLILSGLMVTLYMQIDKVMLGSLMTSKVEVGVYSAATSIASMWYFVPMAIITSFKPVIMSKKKTNEESYLKSIQLLYTIITWLGIGFGIFVIIFSNPIVNILYGSDYQKASDILSVSIWAGTFAMLGSATSIWLISENLQKYKTFFVFSGALTNVVLNYFLIPIIGGNGAAIATLASQFIANIITPIFFKEIRINTKMIFKAFILPFKLRKK
ncbi:flippase [Aerococcus urinaeequi]|uniref:flippase n=1 Tax=Aerococcus urinaeequi TaxID=51665 RepID=UPI002281B32D|nr:flippase [Aerococcus urinaeequi]MCY7731096.1 flippase [Aerococcus urinaeequi]